jgi:hypothetical protein
MKEYDEGISRLSTIKMNRDMNVKISGGAWLK